jgi:putative NADH-flavin reductase
LFLSISESRTRTHKIRSHRNKNTMMLSKILVVGATGATGTHVVQMLLGKGQTVHVIARSKDKMLSLLNAQDYGDRLTVTEASLLDLSSEELAEHTKDCQAVVSCLGHNMSFAGLWGHPRRLVTEAVRRLTTAMPDHCKFILMGSDGVSHPDGTTDKPRALMERTVILLLRYLIPPHADNEQAAAYLHENRSNGVDNWSVVRPTDLIDAPQVSEYKVSEEQEGTLFGGNLAVSRINVAHFMVELILNEEKWKQYKHKMPVLYQQQEETTKEMKDSSTTSKAGEETKK